MIVKSLSRRECKPNFHKLIRYIADVGKSRQTQAITWNTRATDDNLKTIADEFLSNSQFIRDQKGKRVRVYHEIVAFHPRDKAQIDERVTRSVALEYLSRRSPNGLAFAKAHFDQKQIHIHFAISGNQIETDKANRMDKFQFGRVKKGLEGYQREHFPEVKHGLVWTDEKIAERKREKEELQLKQSITNERKQRDDRERWFIKEKEPKLTKKEDLKQRIETALHAKSQADFERLLKVADPTMKLYKRGKNWAVSRIETPAKPTKANPNQEPKEIKYRLVTLGIDFDAKLKEWERSQEPEREPIPQAPQKAPEPPKFSNITLPILALERSERGSNLASQEVSEVKKEPIIEEPLELEPTPEELEEIARQRRMAKGREDLKTTMNKRAKRLKDRKQERGRSR